MKALSPLTKREVRDILPSNQTHSVAKLPAELVVLGDRRSLCEGLRPSENKPASTSAGDEERPLQNELIPAATLLCDICHTFTTDNPRSLNAHKPACKRKHPQVESC